MSSTVGLAPASGESARPALRSVAPDEAARVSVVRVSAMPASAARPRSLTSPAAVVLSRYLDATGRPREVVRQAGALRSVLVIDRASDGGDDRLVAHLAADEPAGNADVVCAAYMERPDASTCRRLLVHDLSIAPEGELEALAAQPLQVEDERVLSATAAAGRAREQARAQLCIAASALSGRDGSRYALELRFVGKTIPELRWCVARRGRRSSELVSVREVIGALERYEPVRSLTARAIAAHRDDPAVSVATLGVELDRLNASRTVLNRGLRATVLRHVEIGSASMSEIALRCGRVKCDSRGLVSGETSWLARRIGVTADAPGYAPSPWVHSDVLALIARTGLGVSPREVEVE